MNPQYQPDECICLSAISDPSYKFLVCFSGGKDSIAMVLYLLERGVERNRIVLHHHDVDGGGENLFDWAVTTEYCRAFAQQFQLDILFSFRDGGILREIYRENEGLQDILYQQEPGGEYIRLKSQKGNSTRRKFPAVAADLRTRWCSSTVKIDVLSRVISNNPQYAQGNFIICTGERRQESSNRAKYLKAEKYRTHTKKRNAYQWRPIIDWTEENVWHIIESHKVQVHPCYELGWNRCSCQTCIFSSADIWASVFDINPEKVYRFIDIEKEIEHTLYNKMTLEDKVLKGNSFIVLDSDFWIQQATKAFTMPIIVEGEWTLPKGAYLENICGSV